MKIVLHSRRSSNGQIVIGDMPIFILSLLIIISEIPIWARNVPNIVFYGLIALFVVSSIKVLTNLESYRGRTILWLVLYLIMISIYKLLAISSADLSYYSTTVKFFFFLFAMLIICGHMTRRQKIYIYVITLGSMFYTTLDNIRLFLQYGPTVFVHLFQWERFTTNSVNTTYVSSQLLLAGILFAVFLHTNKRALKIGIMAVIALNIVFIAAIAQRMIILGLAIVMFPLLLLYNQKYSYKRIVIMMLVAILMMILLINFSSIIDILDKLIGSGRMHLRFEQLKLFFATKQTGSDDGTMSARIGLYMRSINTWFSSFSRIMFGAGDHRITNDIIGNHSDYIDECARYGIVGMLIWVPFTVNYMQSIIKCGSIRRRTALIRQMRVIFIIFILNALLSSVYEATVGIQMFILLPITFSLIDDNNEAVKSSLLIQG